MVGGTGPCAVSASNGPRLRPYTYLLAPAAPETGLQLVEDGHTYVPLAPLPSADPVVELQMVTLDQTYVALVGQAASASTGVTYTAIAITAAFGGVHPIEVLAVLMPGQHRGRPRITLEGSQVVLANLATDPGAAPGAAVLSRTAIFPATDPGSATTRLSLPTDASTAAAVGIAGGLTYAFAGPYATAPGAGAKDVLAPVSAWIQVAGEMGLRRLARRPTAEVSSPAVVVDAAGSTLVAFAPTAGEPGTAGFASLLAADVLARPQVVPLSVAEPVVASALLGPAGGAAGSLLEGTSVFVTTRNGPNVGYLGVVPSPALRALPWVAATGRDTAAASPGQAPALNGLGPGVNGASFCGGPAGAGARTLVPVDPQGQALGSPVDLGTHLSARLLQVAPALACPPAPLVQHGGRLLASMVEDGQVVLRELICGETAGR
jgi:hypothetical protein